MKKQLEEYNKKYFRNIQFIYDFLDKIGMKNSLRELRNESKINYVKEYDDYFLENELNYFTDNKSSSEDDEESDDSIDYQDINPELFFHTINQMNNSILCKAIDSFEIGLKNRSKEIKNEAENNNIDNDKKNEYQNCQTIKNNIRNSTTIADSDIIFNHVKEQNDSMNKINFQKIKENVKLSEKLDDIKKSDITNSKNEENFLKNIIENVKDSPFPNLNALNLPIYENYKNSITTTEKILDCKSINKDQNSTINNLSSNSNIQNYKSLANEKREEHYTSIQKEERDIITCKTEQKEKNNNEINGNRNDSTYNWDNYFSNEKSISKEVKIKYISSNPTTTPANITPETQKNEKKNDEHTGKSNILFVKYIDIYNIDKYKNSKFENVIFFNVFFPIIILVGYADGSIKLLFIIYEKNQNKFEECMHICKGLDEISLGSPIMYIDINYKDNIFITSTMSGQIYICHIDIQKINKLTDIIEGNNSIDNIKNNIKGDTKYINIIKKLAYHNGYSSKCLFNYNSFFFCSIANDKNLIIYEKIKDENSDLSPIYDKKKIIGLPETPTSVLWIYTNNIDDNDNKNKELIAVSMLNSNHILLINSETYCIEDKIYLFDATEKYNILNLEYNRKKNIIIICADTSTIFVYSILKKEIIKKIYGCVLNSLSFPTMEMDINGNNIYITSDDYTNGTHILIFDIKSGNMIDSINNGYKIRCFRLLKSYICPFLDDQSSKNVEENKKALLILGSFDKKIHFFSN
ncbi:WD repeat-containing protein, putative [Plasmodium yoelii]|uniref:WD repeat-containing protein n=2 Tax=Plasmodium yoelii TaxID=5861 RepID=A0AAF0B7Z1_PLAYO|nr:WD repeat-containing protein, putative [Plasmodium yoelii]WBY60959.1 WD repeat-containing protein [Plasmodium yoelii yoelii]CDU20716.1 conserved Plasmodium protein, unknown function [Plasmodium yoelii]VTZ81679.1 WD repeat-containing protein, putative [Plasmodium yoelii]|eukprot:XP_022812947.1 WD repeat-containing protein, putative [Plasmodium yoelii]